MDDSDGSPKFVVPYKFGRLPLAVNAARNVGFPNATPPLIVKTPACEYVCIEPAPAKLFGCAGKEGKVSKLIVKVSQ